MRIISFNPISLLHYKIKIMPDSNRWTTGLSEVLPEILLMGRYQILHGYDLRNRYTISTIHDSLLDKFVSNPNQFWIDKFYTRLENEFPEIML